MTPPIKQQISDWYWTFGIQRGTDPGDPDRALRKITVGGWFDSVSHSAARIEILRDSLSSKSCIALWGPSQTGKSTLLSRYLDGSQLDGSDSPLTWDPNRPIRFSPSTDFTTGDYPRTLVFNPYRVGSDASGVVTRYTLPKDASNVSSACPIGFKIGSRVAILHAIALGYLTECNPANDKIVVFNPEEFLESLGQPAPEGMPPSREAYEWLRDAADVLERLRYEARFANLFHGEWERRIRPALVSAPALLASPDAAKSLVANLLWDSVPRITSFFDAIEGLRATLAKEWSDIDSILLSPEVAALVLDIGTIEAYLGGTRTYPTPNPDTQSKLDRIACSRNGQSVCITIGDSPSGAPIAGSAFGCFQALCSEIVVPLRREAFPLDSPMLRLLDEHDLLDFPGLGHLHHDGTTKDDTKVCPETLSDIDFFRCVLKEGRTQSIVFGHIDAFAVDSFIVLNSAAQIYPAKSNILSNGIASWLRSFDPDWAPRRPSPLPLFLDLTFFAQAVNGIPLNGVSEAFPNYATRSLDTLPFAAKETAQWFLTTYPQFPVGAITSDAMSAKDNIVSEICNCTPFTAATGLKHDDIAAVFAPDGGTGRMIDAISSAVKPNTRRNRCAGLLRSEINKLVDTLSRQLPSDEQIGNDARRNCLAETARMIRDAIAAIEDGDRSLDYASLAGLIRNLFAAPPDAFAPLPSNLQMTPQRKIEDWLKDQFRRWFDDAEKRVVDHRIIDAAHQRELLCALRDSLPLSPLVQFLKNRLGSIDHATSRAARTPFAVAFGNVIRFGSCERSSDIPVGEGDSAYLETLVQGLTESSDAREASPHFKTVIEPALVRIDDLAQTARAGDRPKQPGDDELLAIRNQLAAFR